MKILQINALYGYKSTGTIVRDIGEAVERGGGEAYFAYQSYRGNAPRGCVVGNKTDWKVHALFSRVFGKQAYFSRRATKRLIKYIDSISPDVVHLHNLHSNFVNLNLLLDHLGKKDIATVVTMHDCWYFTGKCYHYQEVACDKFTTDCKNCPQLREDPPSFFFDKANKMLSDRKKYFGAIPRLYFVGCSDWICNEAKRGFPKNMNVSRIYNGVDTETFCPRDSASIREKYGIPESAFVTLGMASKWIRSENENLLCEFASSLSDDRYLVLFGCNDEKFKRIAEINNSHIIPIGYVEGREELAKIYSMANVFANVTHADTLPTVNMEAICCGTPVVTYDSCGSPELVLDGCGAVVPRGDATALMKAIYSVTEKIDKDSLAMARDVFDKNKCYEKYIELYKALMKRKD